MKKGLQILADGNTLPSNDQQLSPDTVGQLEDLMVEFWADTSMSAEDAQQRYYDILSDAD